MSSGNIHETSGFPDYEADGWCWVPSLPGLESALPFLKLIYVTMIQYVRIWCRFGGDPPSQQWKCDSWPGFPDSNMIIFKSQVIAFKIDQYTLHIPRHQYLNTWKKSQHPCWRWFSPKNPGGMPLQKLYHLQWCSFSSGVGNSLMESLDPGRWGVDPPGDFWNWMEDYDRVYAHYVKSIHTYLFILKIYTYIFIHLYI